MNEEGGEEEFDEEGRRVGEREEEEERMSGDLSFLIFEGLRGLEQNLMYGEEEVNESIFLNIFFR